MPGNGTRLIRCLKLVEVIRAQVSLQCAQRVIQLAHLAGPDDRAGDARLVQHPGQRHLHRLGTVPRRSRR